MKKSVCQITSKDLSRADESRTNENNVCATANLVKRINVSDVINEGTQSTIENNADNNTNDAVVHECDNAVSVKWLRYVIGYVAHKYPKLYPDLSVPSEEMTENDFIKKPAEDLRETSELLLIKLQLAEKVLRKVHGELFSTVNVIIHLETEVSFEKSSCIPWA
ncbi:hypothetical protein PR048_008850 [Dryococelus australis]|uniref:Uncharacterized protein n=1 Tax=Dryococelus australis TaxID=614101 RepID=A0ABQ9HY98_9NEOP|nr:hypothetical protein PR048_008850 [Dryococelus australis]